MAQNKSSEIVIIANTIAVALAQDLNADEENILGNLFALVGASLSSLAALDSSNSSASTDSSNSSTSTDSSNSSASSDKTNSSDSSKSPDTSTITTALKYRY